MTISIGVLIKPFREALAAFDAEMSRPLLGFSPPMEMFEIVSVTRIYCLYRYYNCTLNKLIFVFCYSALTTIVGI